MGEVGGEIFEEIFSRVQDCWGEGGDLFIPPIPQWIIEWSSWPLPWFTPKVSHPRFIELVQLNIFIDGLRSHSKLLLDASTGGKIKLKTPDEAMELIENMAASDHAILRDRAYTPTKKSLLELTSQDALVAQNKLLAKQLETLIETLSKLPQQL